MQKNLVLFIVMSVSIYLGWMWYLSKAYPEMGKVKAHSAVTPGAEKAKGSGPVVVQAPAAQPLVAAKAKPVALKASIAVLKNEDLEVELSSVGAKVKSWKLLQYKEHLGQADPVQLVPPQAEPDQFAAFEMGGTTLDSDNWSLDSSTASSAVFSISAGQGLRVRKTISLDGKGCLAHVRIDYINGGKAELKLPKSYLIWGGGIGSHDEGRQAAMSSGGAVQMQGKIERQGLGDAKVFGYSDPKWVAVKNHYFVAAWMNDGAWAEAELRRSVQGVTKTVTAALGAGELSLKAGETRTLEARLYAGPQLYDTLSAFGNNLQAVVQFTFQWLSPLSVGQLKVMQWLNKFTHNWGVAIILLTLLVKLALFYPTHKGMVSSRRMQSKMAVMKPVLDSLKKTYKDDAAKLNQETMKLYKEHGVNPMGGCFLMLPQMFIMISLYGALNGAFELRNAAFFWVWKDLSAADPTFILVPLMGASMFLQQKMTPTNTATMSDDQAQMQKTMTYMMPVMFTVMGFLFKWPTGLLIYWSVSNAFGIAQQWYVNKTNP